MKMETHISPSYTQEKLDNPTFDDLVDVFKDRVLGWLFAPAEKLVEETDSRFAGLCLILTYFEGIWSYLKGENSRRKSKQFFIDAFCDIFSTSHHSKEMLQKAAEVIYIEGRCGFFHDAMLRSPIFIANLKGEEMLITFPVKANGTIDRDGPIKSIIIDPKNFIEAAKTHFYSYLLCIRNPNSIEKRDNFMKMAKEKWDYEGDDAVIGLDPDRSQ